MFGSHGMYRPAWYRFMGSPIVKRSIQFHSLCLKKGCNFNVFCLKLGQKNRRVSAAQTQPNFR